MKCINHGARMFLVVCVCLGCESALGQQSSVSIDFSSGRIASRNTLSYQRNGANLDNRYDDSYHLYYYRGASFSFQFALEGIVSSAQLKVKHLSSASEGSPGYTPVTLLVNGQPAASWNRLSAGYRVDSYEVGRYLSAGNNRIEFRYSPTGGTTGYWQKSIELEIVRDRAGTTRSSPMAHVNQYAPIVSFSNLVRYMPTRFPADEKGPPCCYVNIKPLGSANGALFQYWLYYAKDIKIDEAVDKVGMTIQGLCSIDGAEKLCRSVNLDKFFHDHDWELVEVVVPALGERPSEIIYHAHSQDLRKAATPDLLLEYQPKVAVLTDMHGSYPPNWEPRDIAGFALSVVEYNIAQVLPSVRAVAAGQPSGPLRFTRTLNLSKHCRPFTEKMMEVTSLPGYPYKMPWRRGFKY